MLQGRTIAITGATGFVGSHIALALHEAGARVRGVVRTPSKGAWLEERGIELARADLMEPDALQAAFEGCDAVVANAALGSFQGDLEDFDRVNRQGTENTVRSMVAAGVDRLVQISSVAVYRTRLFRPMDEDTPRYDAETRRWQPSDLTTDWRYARTKRRAEDAVWSLAEAHGVRATTLRPGPVYGSRDPKLTARYLARLERPVVAAPTVAVPHVHAGDVGDAVVRSLARDVSIGRAYNLSGASVSPYRVMRTLAKLSGRRTVVVPVPVPAWVVIDAGAAERDLGFAPRSIEEGLREVLSWSS